MQEEGDGDALGKQSKLKAGFRPVLPGIFA
jgi:hypothetical protein